jgi:hypothetical protein
MTPIPDFYDCCCQDKTGMSNWGKIVRLFRPLVNVSNFIIKLLTLDCQLIEFWYIPSLTEAI